MPQLRTPPKAQSAKYLKKIYLRRGKFLTIKYFIAQIVVANFVWNFRIFSYKCYGTNVSLLVAAELAAVLLGGCGSHRALRGGRHAALQNIFQDC